MGKWKARRTLLIVGEGHNEVAFLNHIKQLAAVRGQGVQITIKNARGKGATGVISYTVRQIANAEYDSVAVLLDTDTDWTEAAKVLAASKSIQVLASEPCFEALLLRVLGKKPKGRKELKRQFSPYVKNDGTCREDYAEHFGLVVLRAVRHTELALDELLKLFGV